MCPASRAGAPGGRVVAAPDARVELLAVAHLLMPPGRRPRDFAARADAYARRLLKAFGGFSRHPGVRLSAALDPAGFPYAERLRAVAHCAPPPELSFGESAPAGSVAAAGGSRAFARWLSALGELARGSRFAARWPECARALKPAAAELGRELARSRPAARIGAYAGLPFRGEYRVAPCPSLRVDGMVNVLVPRPGGRDAILTALGPLPGPGGRPGGFADSSLACGCWHELAHSLLDPLADLCREALERVRPGAQAPFDSALQCMKEHAARAVMLRLAGRHLGPRLRAAQREEELADGCDDQLLARLEARLGAYERGRARRRGLADFYCEWLELRPAVWPPGGPAAALERALPFAFPAPEDRARGRALARLLREGAARA